MTADLSTTYLGSASSRNPLVASSSPMTDSVESTASSLLEAAGIAAAVVASVHLWEEQIEHEAMEMQRLYEVNGRLVCGVAVRLLPGVPGLRDQDRRPISSHLRRRQGGARPSR